MVLQVGDWYVTYIYSLLLGLSFKYSLLVIIVRLARVLYIPRKDFEENKCDKSCICIKFAWRPRHPSTHTVKEYSYYKYYNPRS